MCIHRREGDTVPSERWCGSRPLGLLIVPRGCFGFVHAREEKLDHKPVVVAVVGHGSMPEVVVGNSYAASRRDERELSINLGTFRRVEVVAAWNDARRPTF